MERRRGSYTADVYEGDRALGDNACGVWVGLPE